MFIVTVLLETGKHLQPALGIAQSTWLCCKLTLFVWPKQEGFPIDLAYYSFLVFEELAKACDFLLMKPCHVSSQLAVGCSFLFPVFPVQTSHVAYFWAGKPVSKYFQLFPKMSYKAFKGINNYIGLYNTHALYYNKSLLSHIPVMRVFIWCRSSSDFLCLFTALSMTSFCFCLII